MATRTIDFQFNRIEGNIGDGEVLYRVDEKLTEFKKFPNVTESEFQTICNNLIEEFKRNENAIP